jgi:hypothetical protein
LDAVKCDFNNPNSTDIHAIEKINSITSYVVKYVCKKDDRQTDDGHEVRKIEGRIWGCSDALRSIKHYEKEIVRECGFDKIVSNSDEMKVVKKLERTLHVDNVIRKEDAGIIILLLPKKTKMRDVLKAQFPDVYLSYIAHYQAIYSQLYLVNDLDLESQEFIECDFWFDDSPVPF